VLAAAAAEASSYPRYWQPVVLAGAQLPALLGRRVEQIALLRCAPPACVPIPFQVDERDDAGEWALPHGPGAAGDETPGVVDDNDDLIFLAADGGARALAGARRSGAVLEVEINDPLGFPPRYVYLAAGAVQAPRSPLRYVAYDAAADQLAGRVTLGFSGGVPQLLTLAPGGENVLDRLKIRAAASFLWGLLRVARSEQDILPQAVSWSAGPVRVIRRQALQIRMRFGIRSPRFTSTTYFYRDFAELPLSIRLRVPPRYLFTSITVRGGLDFRHLPGAWRVLLPGSDGALPAGCEGDGVTERDGVAGDWFALEGPDLTLVQRLQRGPTLASVHQSTWYRNGREEDPPESAPGQCPAAGFVLDDWDAVEGGVHTLTSTSYAVAPDVGVGVFLATVEVPLEVSVRPLPPP
jgi:hypothetical protein